QNYLPPSASVQDPSSPKQIFIIFFLNDPAPSQIYTLSLHDALPIFKLIRVSLGTVRHPRRFKIVVIDIQITLKQMLRDFIGIRVNRAKKSGMVNITSSVNSRERSGINTTGYIDQDRKSGSAGMPRQNSYAVFCLKK